MNKLIKFFSLATFFGSSLSLSAAAPQPQEEQLQWSRDGKFIAIKDGTSLTYATLPQPGSDIYTQTHILTNVFLDIPLVLNLKSIENKDHRIFLYTDNIDSKIQPEARKDATFESLQQQRLIHCILVDTEAYQLMQEKLRSDFWVAKTILYNFNLKNLAGIIIKKFSDKNRLKEFTAKMSQCLSDFPTSYFSEFSLAIAMLVHDGSVSLSDSTDLELFEDLRILNKEISSLVKLAIRIKIGCYAETDNLNRFETHFNLTLVSKDVRNQHIKSDIDDSFITACTIIAAKQLLTQINGQLNKTAEQ